MAIKSTNEILSEILNIITSGLPLPDIKVQLEDIMHNQIVDKVLQEQILQYINKISEDSDAAGDLLRTYIQMFSSYNTDLHSFYQDWLTNITDIKTNQEITNHLTLAIKGDTETMNHLMETQKQQMDIMSLMMCQELSNTNNISILTDLTGQTLYSIKSLLNSVEKINNNVESINENVQKINDINENVQKINDKIPEPGPTPPTPPIPPVPPTPKPRPIIDGSIKWFWCQCHGYYVRFCPKYDCYYCPQNSNPAVIFQKLNFDHF